MRWNRMITVVNCNAEGEVGNVVTGGVFDVPGATTFEKMMHLEEHLDHVRRICIVDATRIRQPEHQHSSSGYRPAGADGACDRRID